MDPQLILFDVDGTLVDSGGAGRQAMEQAFHEVFGVDGVARRAAGVRFAGMTDPSIIESLCLAVGIRPGIVARRQASFEATYLRALSQAMRRPDPRRRTLPGVQPLLDALEARPRTHLGLLTGNLERAARIKLEPFDLNRFFPSGGFGSDDRDRRTIARIARERLSALTGVAFAGSSVTVIGDTEHDVDCARANGFRAVAVQSGWVSRERLEQALPDALLDDLTDAASVFEALGLPAQLS